MKFVIKHEIRGRIRVHLCQDRMTVRQADLLSYYLSSLSGVEEVKVYERTADALVPWSLGGTALTWLLTRNAAKALSVLMVDFSCALKLAMPLSVLSAMREANSHRITVKGGTYLETIAEADTIVFDKTGTLTKAEPVVSDIVTFEGRDKNEMLRIAACLEEHFPHSMANAVVNESVRRGLLHNTSTLFVSLRSMTNLLD